MPNITTLTQKLHLYSNGDHEIGDDLFAEMYPRLRKVAARMLSRDRFARVSATELVGETWLSNLRRGKWQVENREHFYGIVGKAMENVLKDMARRRLAQRRGNGAVHISMQDVLPSQQPVEANAEQVVALCLLVEQLSKVNPRAASIFRLHHFVGFTLEEIAEGTGLTLRQVRYLWGQAKQWIAGHFRLGE